jgi:hypothetical protein
MANKGIELSEEGQLAQNENLAKNNKPIVLPNPKTHMNKVLIVLCRPVLTMADGHIKYGQVPGGTFVWDLNRKDYRGFVRWKNNLYRCVVSEPALFSINGMGIVYYDVEGAKPLDVRIDDVPNQVESRMAEKIFGIDTMSKAFGAMNPNKSSSIGVYIIMLIMGLLGGILADHFLHV